MTTLVLHVDDEPAFAELQRTYLEEVFDTPFTVETVTDPSDGLAFVEGHDVDCVVCDYDMPEMDGLELLERVRESHPVLPFVLLTGRGSEAVASEAIGKGVTDYVSKPSGSREYRTLANRIHSAVSQYRRGQRARAEADALRALCDRLPHAVLGVDVDRRVTAANERAERLLDRSGEALRGTPLRETPVAPTGSPVADALDRAMEAGAPVTVEVHDDDLGRDLRVELHPGPDGATVVVVDPDGER